MKRGEPLKRTVGLARGPVNLKRTPLSRSSSPRPARQPAREATKAPGWGEDTRETVWRRSGGRCELGACTREATDLHHRQRRREGRHDATNALHVCRDDHRWIHAHPKVARASGWIVSAFAADPATEPVILRGRLCWLTEDGKTVGEVASA